MKYSLSVAGIAITAGLAITLMLASCSDKVVEAQPEYPFDYVRGTAGLWADYDAVFLPGKLSHLYFDREVTNLERHMVPKWRFIGPLKVDSLVRDGKVEPLVEESQLEGVIISPDALRWCLHDHGIFLLQRSIPWAVPYDTLIWSEVRDRWVIVPDLSMHFQIQFDEHQRIKPVIDCLDKVGGFKNLGPIEIPVPD